MTTPYWRLRSQCDQLMGSLERAAQYLEGWEVDTQAAKQAKAVLKVAKRTIKQLDKESKPQPLS